MIKNCITFIILMYFYAIPLLLNAQIFNEDFEKGSKNWELDENNVWQIGQPTTDQPGEAHSGLNCAGTVLDGEYSGDKIWNSLVSPKIEIPAISGNEEIILQFWQYFQYGINGFGKVFIRFEDGDQWKEKDLGKSASYNAEGWSQTKFDLSFFAEKTIQLKFYNADSTQSLGWYIDDIDIEKQDKKVWSGQKENFENGWNGWYSDHAIWQLGRPKTEIIDKAHSGSSCVGTVLNGKYPNLSYSSLISPEITLPVVSENEELFLVFWQYFHYDYIDHGVLNIRVADKGEMVDQKLGVFAKYYAEDWRETKVDLSIYSGKTVQFKFYHRGHHSSDLGWYIDDIEIRKQKKNIWSGKLESFETGWNGWYIDRAVWQIGTPVSIQPNQAHSGENCIGTIISGNYPEYSESKLISPIIKLPVISGGEKIKLKFWHYYQYFQGMSYGALSIQSFENNSWSDNNKGVLTRKNDSKEWKEELIDISDFSGKIIRLNFKHKAETPDEYLPSLGWYIDDVEILTPNDPEKPSKLSGCLNTTSYIKGKAMLLQSGEYHQTVNIDTTGCYAFERYEKNKPFTIIIRSSEDNSHILSK